MENKIYISDSYDPFFNLAVETMLFETCSASARILYLWKNEDVVVIGRYQNPWRECDIDKMNEDGVHLMRRYTGGGAVFHDANNICFSFISKKPCSDTDLSVLKAENSSVICDAVRSFGVDAEISGRNDIMVSGHKISGAAYREGGEYFLHHGTLLVGTDLTRLATYLQPDERKLKSKGIASVRSRVANLRDLVNGENEADVTIEKVCDAVCERFMRSFKVRYNADDVTHINKDALEKNLALRTEYEKLKNWEWRFGKSPEFMHRVDERFKWGGVDIQLNVKDAIVQSVEVFTDALDIQLVDEIKSALYGVVYSAENLRTALQRKAAALKDTSRVRKNVSLPDKLAPLAEAEPANSVCYGERTIVLAQMLCDVAFMF